MPVGANTSYPIAQQSWRENCSVPIIRISKTVIPQQCVGMQEATQHLEAVLLHLVEAEVLLHLAEVEVEAEDGEKAGADRPPRTNLQAEMRRWTWYMKMERQSCQWKWTQQVPRHLLPGQNHPLI